MGCGHTRTVRSECGYFRRQGFVRVRVRVRVRLCRPLRGPTFPGALATLESSTRCIMRRVSSLQLHTINTHIVLRPPPMSSRPPSRSSPRAWALCPKWRPLFPPTPPSPQTSKRGAAKAKTIEMAASMTSWARPGPFSSSRRKSGFCRSKASL